MEYTNAFVGKKERPSDTEVSTALGAAAGLWTEFIDWMAKKEGVPDQEWKGIYVHKYGWSLRLRRKGRNIVHLSPGEGCFLAAFILGEKAVKAAKEAHLPRAAARALDEAKRYPEGTGLRIVVHRAADLAAIEKLASIKVAN